MPQRRCLLISAIGIQLLPACSSTVRLEIEDGRSFRLTDAADPGPQALEVSDRRPSNDAKAIHEPLLIVPAEHQFEPSPPVAFRSEVFYLRTARGSNGDIARAVKAQGFSIDAFSFTIRAADVSQPRGPTGLQPPPVELFGAGARSLGQAMAGGADMNVELIVSANNRTVVGKSRWRATANPGHASTIQAFRLAVLSVLSQLAEGSSERAA